MKNTNNSVKNQPSYWVLLFALLVGATMQAKVYNYVGAYANVGEWTLLPTKSAYGPSFGVNGGIGAMYELQAGKKYSQTRFLLNVGVGLNGGLTSFIQGSNVTQALANQYDLDGDLFDYMYEMKNRHDRYTDLALNVPLMIGVQHKKFYMLAGVKMYSHLMTRSHSSATVNTYGRYAQFDEFRNMPEYQFFTGLSKTDAVNTKFKLDFDLSLEIGGRLGLVTDAVGYDVPKRNVEYRLAGFVDYGLTDLHYTDTKQALIVPDKYDTNPASPNYVYNGKSMIDNLKMNDIMATTGFASKVSNLIVGLKFTVLFQLPEPGQCVICRDAYRNSSVHRRGGVKYEE